MIESVQVVLGLFKMPTDIPILTEALYLHCHNTRTLMVLGKHLQALPTECMSFSTACLTASLWHTASQLSVFKCSEAARAFSCFCLGTTRHMAYILLLSAYTQTFSTNCDWARTASTLPSDTYSPSCSFTKSFLRSVKV